MKYVKRDDAVHAVLHHNGQAAVASVQDLPAIDIVQCKECKYGYCANIEKRKLLSDAADAIERLTEEIDRKDKAIERMRNLMRHYKAAYRTAYKLYQEARK